MYRPANYELPKTMFGDTAMDTNTSKWYMYKTTNSIGRQYFAYSKTWSCVTDFRKYFSGNAHKDSDGMATVTKYSVSNWKDVVKKLKVGDVVQYDENGYHHSIIISLIYDYNGAHYVKYCGHSTTRKNTMIDVFHKRLCEIKAKYVYVISYK